ncbi:MAG: flippase-like domain-containing protein [Bacteroidales bacterium]|nr:flippase-like domain-containing protein [Bacteroidales bacterium]
MIRALKRYILWALCLGLFAWMLLQANPRQLWQNLLDWNWILLGCIGVWLIGYLLNAASFRCILRCFSSDEGTKGGASFQGEEGLFALMRLTIGGYALNYITPFGLLGGEPWRIHELRKVMSADRANSSVTYYAMVHVLSHILFWFLALLAWGMLNHSFGLGEYSGWTLVGIIVGILVLLTGVVYFLQHKGWIQNFQVLARVHPRLFLNAIGWELLSRLVNVLEYWLLMRGILSDGLATTYGGAFLVVAFSSLFANILFFSPMQMGTREGGVYLALQWLLPSMVTSELFALSVSICFATRIREIFWIVVGLIMIKIKSNILE